MRWSDRSARRRTSSGTSIWNCRSANEARTFSSVIFMFGHTPRPRRKELGVRPDFPERMNHAVFRRDNEAFRRAVLDEPDHVARAQEGIRQVLHRLGTLRVRDHDRVRVLLLGFPDVLLGDQHVRRAVAGPQDQIPARLLLDELPQVDRARR